MHLVLAKQIAEVARQRLRDGDCRRSVKAPDPESLEFAVVALDDALNRSVGQQEGFALVPKEPTDEMLNAAQSRLCEMENFTNFNDRHQAEMFKAMVAAVSEPKRYLTEG